MEDWTDQLALLNIQGPLSRNVLDKVVCKDTHNDSEVLANDNFPFSTWKKLRLRNGVEATVCRLTYVGENGYELYVPMAEAVRVAEMILNSDPSVRLAGIEASKCSSVNGMFFHYIP